MSCHDNSSSLQTLAQKAFVKQIKTIGLRMLQNVTSKQDGNQTCSEQKMKDVVETCEKVEEMISNIPSNIIEDVILDILRQLDDMYCELSPLIPQHSDVKYLKKFVQSILTARVTRLEINWRWKYIPYFIMENLEFLSRLKVISICEKKPEDTSKHLVLGICRNESLSMSDFHKRVHELVTEKELEKTSVIETCEESQMFNGFLYREMPFYGCHELEHLTLKTVCTDDMIAELSKISRKLKTLNVSRSLNVSAHSIPYIAEFKELTVLDVSHTKIPSDKGRSLFTKMSANGISLKSYTTDTLSYSDLDILADCFPDLLELACMHDTFMGNDPLLKEFPKLKTYRTGVVKVFESHYKFLNSAQNLQELQFEFLIVNITDILKRCPTLRILKINAHTIVESEDVDHFGMLHELSIESNSDVVSHVLSHCINLRKLKLIPSQSFYSSQLAGVLQKNPFEHLEDLTIGVNVPYEALGLITEHCKTLRKVTMLTNDPSHVDVLWTQHPGVEVAYGEKSPVVPRSNEISLGYWPALYQFRRFGLF